MKKLFLLASALFLSVGSLFAQSATPQKTSDTTKTKKMHRAKFSNDNTDKKSGKDTTKVRRRRAAF